MQLAFDIFGPLVVPFAISLVVMAAGLLLGHRRGYALGRKRGALDERRAEAMRRLSAKSETEWKFNVRVRPAGPIYNEQHIYACSPDGKEYTRHVRDIEQDDREARRVMRYDDNWYDVETATAVPVPLANEITNRFNIWHALVQTGARKPSTDDA